MAVALVNKFLDALGLANDNDEQEVENEDIYERKRFRRSRRERFVWR